MSRFFQFVIGFIIGITIVAGSAAGAAYYLITRHNTTPPKPVFAEDSTQTVNQPISQETSPPPSDTTTTSTEPQATSEPSPEPNLPQGAYIAAVTWPQGLSLRQEPSVDAERIGGVGYNAELIILNESSDGEWQKVRVPSSGEEGWVKAGNVRKLE